MSVINCNNIIDVTYLFKLLGMSDLEVFNVKYLEISILLSQQQFMTHSQYFEYIMLSGNLRDCINPMC